MKEEDWQDAESRYEAFLSAVALSGKLWALRNAVGWANWSDEDPRLSSPSGQTSNQRKNALESFSTGIKLSKSDFLYFWLISIPSLRSEQIFIGTNLSPDMSGIDLSCDEFESLFSLPNEHGKPHQ